ncbi:hypothetical protein IWX90DRAFT_482478 [Phyllosticta citrichinensis]|uniref:Uncharacterized protein n=1 Tax=Phyllosticta citrichinensis TaxID=1130410 RepID=A0ABR1Y6E2_9PEZI
MGFMKSVTRWFRMRRIAARVDRERYAKMRIGTYDFSLEGTPKSSTTKEVVVPPVRKLEFASSSPASQSFEDENLFPGFPYTEENDNDSHSCLWDAAAIDQDIEETVDGQLPSPTSTVRSQELQECLRELPPLKAYRFLGLYDPEPSRVYLPPVVADRAPSLESLPLLSPLAISFDDETTTEPTEPTQPGQPEENQAQPTGPVTCLRITYTVSVEVTTEIETNDENRPNSNVDNSSFISAEHGPVIVVLLPTESGNESRRLVGGDSSMEETTQEELKPDVAHLFH